MSNSGLTAEKQRAISERSDIAVTHVSARRGMRPALDEAVRGAYGAALPSTPRAIDLGVLLIVWAGPDQWLFIEPSRAGVDSSTQLAKTLHGLASIVDVSDSRTIFRVATPRPSDALVRSMPIDFAEDAFKPGDVAITHASHLGVMVWRLPDASGYDFSCARTYSRDFADWLTRV